MKNDYGTLCYGIEIYWLMIYSHTVIFLKPVSLLQIDKYCVSSNIYLILRLRTRSWELFGQVNVYNRTLLITQMDLRGPSHRRFRHCQSVVVILMVMSSVLCACVDLHQSLPQSNSLYFFYNRRHVSHLCIYVYICVTTLNKYWHHCEDALIDSIYL